MDGDGDFDVIVTNSIDPDDREKARAFLFENRGSTATPAFYQVDDLVLEPAFNEVGRIAIAFSEEINRNHQYGLDLDGFYGQSFLGF